MDFVQLAKCIFWINNIKQFSNYEIDESRYYIIAI